MKIKQYMITLSDGRRLEVVDAGEEGNPAIIAHNGTPVAPGFLTSQIEDADAKGLRLITYARPGYAESTRQRGRMVSSAAKDTAELADSLGIDRFATWGQSGGGPHTLACGALLGDRVVGVAAIASVAPYGVDGLDFLAGMGQDNIEEFGAALKGEAELQSNLESQIPESSEVDPEEVAQQMKSLLCAADKEVFDGNNGVEVAKLIVGGMQHGLYGWLDDDIAIIKPWGFSLNDIRVPVQVWQGSEDLMVPFSHGKWLAQSIPNVDAHLLNNEGHMSILIKYISDIHEWLRSKF